MAHPKAGREANPKVHPEACRSQPSATVHLLVPPVRRYSAVTTVFWRPVLLKERPELEPPGRVRPELEPQEQAHSLAARRSYPTDQPPRVSALPQASPESRSWKLMAAAPLQAHPQPPVEALPAGVEPKEAVQLSQPPRRVRLLPRLQQRSSRRKVQQSRAQREPRRHQARSTAAAEEAVRCEDCGIRHCSAAVAPHRLAPGHSPARARTPAPAARTPRPVVAAAGRKSAAAAGRTVAAAAARRTHKPDRRNTRRGGARRRSLPVAAVERRSRTTRIAAAARLARSETPIDVAHPVRAALSDIDPDTTSRLPVNRNFVPAAR